MVGKNMFETPCLRACTCATVSLNFFRAANPSIHPSLSLSLSEEKEKVFAWQLLDWKSTSPEEENKTYFPRPLFSFLPPTNVPEIQKNSLFSSVEASWKVKIRTFLYFFFDLSRLIDYISFPSHIALLLPPFTVY